MTKTEFLQKLREALENDLSGAIVQDNINYYDRYISDEVAKGSSEADVIASLGDPWMISRTIVDAPGGADLQGQGSYYEETQDSYSSSSNPDAYQQNENGNVHVFGFDTWWKKLLLVLVIIMIVVGIVAIVTGVLSLLAPVLVPLIIVMIVIRLIGGRS